ncbi:MAG TPA: TIGR00341 family protein [Thermoplasmata archaeon]|nr:TIGR00341 family protein [Thermoplasmata archaeon]
MSLRLLEIHLPSRYVEQLHAVLQGQRALAQWRQELPDNQLVIRVLVSLEQTEPVLDALEQRFAAVEGFRVLLLEVSATLPRPPAEEATPPPATVEPKRAGRRIARVSREELYSDVQEGSRVSSTFVTLVLLSTAVAAIGLLSNSIAVVIAAMVIAPLLMPNVALSLATTLGDIPLAKGALRANALGIFLAIAFAAVIGLIAGVNPSIPEVALRTHVGLADIALALVAGVAGSLSVTTRLSSIMIGVMVAVALLPPVVAFGMLLGARLWAPATGALLLILVNLIGINLAGVMTFLVEGIHPLRWWEADRAKRATWFAIPLWVALLAVLVAVILISQPL